VIRCIRPFTKTEFNCISMPRPASLFTNPPADEFAGITVTPSTCTASLIVAVKPDPFAAVLALTASSSFTVKGVITGIVTFPPLALAPSALVAIETRAARITAEHPFRRNFISRAPRLSFTEVHFARFRHATISATALQPLSACDRFPSYLGSPRLPFLNQRVLPALSCF
jgi:hypothetical protein